MALHESFQQVETTEYKPAAFARPGPTLFFHNGEEVTRDRFLEARRTNFLYERTNTIIHDFGATNLQGKGPRGGELYIYSIKDTSRYITF
jgi:hypothetical protein